VVFDQLDEYSNHTTILLESRLAFLILCLTTKTQLFSRFQADRVQGTAPEGICQSAITKISRHLLCLISQIDANYWSVSTVVCYLCTRMLQKFEFESLLRSFIF